MSDQTETGKGAGTARPFVSPDVTGSLQVQMQALLQEQAEFLDETQRAMAAWTKRRQEAMEANFRTFLQSMGGCKDPAAITAAYGEWLTGSMNRIFADMNDARDEALRLAGLGQKSMTVLFRQGEKAPPPKDTAPAFGEEARPTSSAPRADEFQHAPERKAAE